MGGTGGRCRGESEAPGAHNVLRDEWRGPQLLAPGRWGGGHIRREGAGLVDPGSVGSGSDLTRDGGGGDCGGRGR